MRMCDIRRELKLFSNADMNTAYLYSSAEQSNVPVDSNITFDSSLIYRVGFADFNSSSNELRIKEAGFYKIVFYVDVLHAISLPDASFIGVNINGVTIQNSMNVFFSLSPDNQIQTVYGQFVHYVNAGDILTLVNLSNDAIHIPQVNNGASPDITGSNAVLMVRKVR